MVAYKLRYVIAIRKKGGRKGDRTLYYWHRKGHPLRRLPNNPKDPAFAALVVKLNAEVAATKKETKKKPEGSFGRLADDYLSSPEASGIADKTRSTYSYWLRRIERNYGDLRFKDMTREFVYEVRDALAKTPSSANQCLEVLRMILGWAVERGALKENIARKPKRIRVRPRRAVWDEISERQFLDRAGPTMRLAYLMGVYTGQRLGDICRLTWGQYDGEWIKMRQQKTDTLLKIYVHETLRSELDSAEKRGLNILVTPRGRPFQPSNFNQHWLRVMREAKLSGLQFRDLRRTAMVRYTEADANPTQVTAISGHSNAEASKMIEVYVPRNSKMGKAAVLKLERYERKTRNK